MNSLIRLAQLTNMDKNGGKSENYYPVSTRKVSLGGRVRSLSGVRLNWGWVLIPGGLGLGLQFNSILLCVFYAVFSLIYAVLWVQDAKA